MITHTAPVNVPVIDENNMITTEWSHYFANHAIQTTHNFPEDGTLTKEITPAQIAEIEKEFLDTEQTIKNPKFNLGQLVTNSSTKLPMINVNGTFKTITTT